MATVPPPIPPEQSLITYPSAFPIKVMGTSREMLDELYRTLSTHPMVKVVL